MMSLSKSACAVRPTVARRSLSVAASTSTATVVSPPKAKDVKLWTPINVTKGNLVSSQGGEATRNVDGVVYSISYDANKDEILVVDRNLGVRYPALVDEQSRVRIDRSNPVPHAVPGFSQATFAPVLKASAPGAEVINGRVAMISYLIIAAVEVASGQSALAQLTSAPGAAGALAVGLLTFAASIAPAVAGKVPVSQVLPSENDPYADRNLPYVWHPLAEKLNGRVAMVGLVGLVLFETFAWGGAALF